MPTCIPEWSLQKQGTHDLWALKQDTELNYSPQALKGKLPLPEGVRGKEQGARGKV